MVFDDYFKRKKIIENNILNYGFKKVEDTYIYEKVIIDNFKLIITIKNNVLNHKVIEMDINEEYILYKIDDAKGNFVGAIRKNVDDILKEIACECFEADVFKENVSLKVINYAKEKYNSSLEFLWEKIPDAAVLRNNSNDKWFGLMMIIPKNKLGFKSKELVEILNLRKEKEAENKFLKAYHMNKMSWYTIILNDDLDIDMIYELIDKSFILSK